MDLSYETGDAPNVGWVKDLFEKRWLLLYPSSKIFCTLFVETVVSGIV